MPFKKCNININKSFGSSPRTIYMENEDGQIEEKTEDCNKKLPDAENFEIQKQIESGVNIKEVNTKIIGNKINEKELGEAIERVKKQRNKKQEQTDNKTKEN